MPKRILAIAAMAAAGVAAAGGVLLAGAGSARIPAALSAVAMDPPRPLQSFHALLDHANQAVTVQRLRGRWTFVFFGFTHCPDVCPATMTQLKLVKKRLRQTAGLRQPVQFLFISVDPARDTVAHLAKYMEHWGADFVGVTGDEAAIRRFEKQFGAYHRYGPKNAAGHYAVLHSGYVYLLDPAGRWTAKFSPPMDPAQAADQVTQFAGLYRREAPATKEAKP